MCLERFVNIWYIPMIEVVFCNKNKIDKQYEGECILLYKEENSTPVFVDL